MQFVCPRCGESEDLTGSPSPEGIRVRCGKCETSWLRDSEPKKCATCGGTDVELRPRALTQYSRGTQLSITGMSTILLCWNCDRRMLEWSMAGRAVPFSYQSAAVNCDVGPDEEGGRVRLTPQ